MRAASDYHTTATDDLLADLAQQFAEAFAHGFADWARQHATDSAASSSHQSARSSNDDPVDDTFDWARSTAGRAGIRFCAATTKKGMPCMATAKPGSDFCHAHDPDRRLCAGFTGRSGTRPCRATALAGQRYCYWHANLYGTQASNGTAGASSSQRTAQQAGTASGAPTTALHDETGYPANPSTPLQTLGGFVTSFWLFFLGPLWFVIFVKWMEGDFNGEDADIDKRLAVAFTIALVDLALLGRVIAAIGRALGNRRSIGTFGRVAWAAAMLIATVLAAVLLYREMPTPDIIGKAVTVGIAFVVVRIGLTAFITPTRHRSGRAVQQRQTSG
jgi:hypothetical protein